MKIALIRRNFSATGGAELYLQRLLGALASAGHQSHLFTEGWCEGVGATLHAVEVQGSRAQRPLDFARKVQESVSQQRFDCVFSLERTLQQDVYRAGDGVHRVWMERRKQFAPAWKRPFVGLGAFHRNMMELERQTFSPANTRHLIVNSQMVREEIIEHFQFPADRIHLVRNGIDLSRFRNGQREATRAKLGLAEDAFVLLFVGSGWERKGLHFLLKTMPRLPDCELLVVGKGKPPLSFPKNVRFLGPMADVENACAAADLFVFLPIYEPSANVCAEALAAGLPVITTAQNGAGELIAPGRTGSVLADPADIGAIVGAVRLWQSKPGRVSLTDARELSIERNAAETVAVLEMAAAGK